MTFRLWLDPADTLMIRDGRPFNQDDAGRAAAASRFPPPPDTIYGAARVALARNAGWTGVGDWTDQSNFVAGSKGNAANKCAGFLGSWKHDKERFRCAGPYFHAGSHDLLPIPANVFAVVNGYSGEVMEIKVHAPAVTACMTELGSIRLIDLPVRDVPMRDEPLGGRWAPREIVCRLLTGQPVTPAELQRPKEFRDECEKVVTLAGLGWRTGDLAATEPRVGLARDNKTRRAEEGQLYVSVRRQLMHRVRMFAEIDGVKADWVGRGVITTPLGGEARFAFAQMDGGSASVVEPCDARGNMKPLIYCATPLMLKGLKDGADASNPDLIRQCLPDFVAAAIPRLEMQAGYRRESVGDRGSFSASRPVIPAGSVFFLEGEANLDDWRGRVADCHIGYGQFIQGGW